MVLDKKTIETISVNAVRDSIVTTEYLDQFINDNDKEPSWDGHVYIYKDKSKRKSALKGRMPVQVKGRYCDNHSRKIIKFNVKTTDLYNYLNDGGCILFVVYIGNHGLTKKIYYIELTPLKLRTILEKANNQTYKSIKLKEFPVDNNAKTTIFLNCLKNCQMQASFKEGKLYTLEELQKLEVLEDVFIPFEGIGIKSPQSIFFNNEVYVYAKVKGSSIPQPIEMIPENAYTNQEFDAKIMIGERIFYNSYSIIENSKEKNLCIGDSLKITFYVNNNACKIKYRNSYKVRQLAKDLDFMLNYYESGYFMINDYKFPFNYDGRKSDKFDIDKELINLKNMKQIVMLLDILGCSDDLDLRDMKDEDWKNINYLISTLVDKKTIKLANKSLPSIGIMSVGKLKILVYVMKEMNSSEYRILDYFKTKFQVVIKDDDGKMLPVSQFLNLKKEDFLTISNIDYEAIFSSFIDVERHYKTISTSNFFLLELLNTVDESSGIRKEKLLNLADKLSEWIFNSTDEELDYDIRLINRLQTIKRIRSLNDNEIMSLYEIIEKNKQSKECLVAVYLLLEKYQMAKKHYSSLPKKEQKVFKKYPIYHFFEKEDKC